MNLNTRNYGNLESLYSDIKQLNRILDDQGINLFIDVIAEYVGTQSVKYNFSSDESNRLRDSIVNDLTEQINERI